MSFAFLRPFMDKEVRFYDAPTAKVCKVCGVSKPLDQYSDGKGGKYGKRAMCKPCNSAINLAAYHRRRA